MPHDRPRRTRQAPTTRAPPPCKREASMAKKITSRPVPRRHRERIDEVVLNALAFSTLLSSQETGAHHPPALTALPGQPLNFTQFVPSCQHNSRRFPVVL